MLFNSIEFFSFLAFVVLFYHFSPFSRQANNSFLILFSIFFYGWWNIIYVPLILLSICINYFCYLRIRNSETRKSHWMSTGVIANLSLIAYFKYGGFLSEAIYDSVGYDLGISGVVLPLAISFFTFQQIAFLVDANRGEVSEVGFRSYALFVLFFPQLIAGPIVHHKEMMPQFERKLISGIRNHLFVGVNLFALGLFKKAVLADGIAPYATDVFDAAALGANLTLIEAWAGTMAYTLQIYFDFSGYSDMACGLGRMFGIILPINFNSPYRSTSIIEFWRRWHMTLSRFLKDYLYITLGGNRRGYQRQLVNVMIVMLLGGLWHGAGWTFVVWGGLHGIFLVINHLWRELTGRLHWKPSGAHWTVVSWGLTILVVMIAWVPFRADTFEAAFTMYRGMFGLNGVVLPPELAALNQIFAAFGFELPASTKEFVFKGRMQIFWTAALFAIAIFLPNNFVLLSRFRPFKMRFGPASMFSRFLFVPGLANALFIGIVASLAALFVWQGKSEFLYFQF